VLSETAVSVVDVLLNVNEDVSLVVRADELSVVCADGLSIVCADELSVVCVDELSIVCVDKLLVASVYVLSPLVVGVYVSTTVPVSRRVIAPPPPEHMSPMGQQPFVTQV
jgi:hypothetical protein